MPDDGKPAVDAQADRLRLPTPPASVWLLGASLVLIAFNLRAAVSSVGPVLRDIIATSGLSAAGASVLTTLPSLCFGLAALAATGLSRRLGPERAVLAGLAALTVGPRAARHHRAAGPVRRAGDRHGGDRRHQRAAARPGETRFPAASR